METATGTMKFHVCNPKTGEKIGVAIGENELDAARNYFSENSEYSERSVIENVGIPKSYPVFALYLPIGNAADGFTKIDSIQLREFHSFEYSAN